MTKYYIYMLTNASGMFYVGLTTNLEDIVKKHKQRKMHSFDGNLEFNRLVHSEEFSEIDSAMKRLDELKSASYYQKQQLAKPINQEID